VYYEDYPKREMDIARFVELSQNFADRGALLSALVLEPVEMSALEAKPEMADELPLVLSTIHSAKGLEFHTVFLIQALDGILPSSYAIRDEEALEEELRLFYVAVTRAEEYLFITYPVFQYQRWGEQFSRPSRFLDAIPEALLEPLELVEEDEVSSGDMPPPFLSDGS